MWQVDPSVRPGSAVWKHQLRQYRRKIVVPALMEHQTCKQHFKALPWGWIAAQGGRSFARRSFNAWWHIRTFGTLVRHVRKGVCCETCPLCSSPTPALREHLESECPVFLLRSQVEGWDVRKAFHSPLVLADFLLALAAVDSLIHELASEDIIIS